MPRIARRRIGGSGRETTASVTTETIMTNDEFDLDLEELSSAEDFLTYFAIDFDPAIVHVNRLHILQRFHDYLEQVDEMPDSAIARWGLYADLLNSAYRDFVVSDAATEKVFRVFRMNEPKTVKVALSDLTEQMPNAAGL
jgi:nitrogenase-stabilizing/protective protein